MNLPALLPVVFLLAFDIGQAEHGPRQLTGLLRCLGSSQAWLRMREEFGVPGAEAGPLMRWAVDTLVRAARAGELPQIDVARPEDGDTR